MPQGVIHLQTDNPNDAVLYLPAQDKGGLLITNLGSTYRDTLRAVTTVHQLIQDYGLDHLLKDVKTTPIGFYCAHDFLYNRAGALMVYSTERPALAALQDALDAAEHYPHRDDFRDLCNAVFGTGLR